MSRPNSLSHFSIWPVCGGFPNTPARRLIAMMASLRGPPPVTHDVPRRVPPGRSTRTSSRQRRARVRQTVQPVISDAEIKAGVSELQRGHIRFDELDRVLHAASARLPARPLEHVGRDVGRDVTHGLAGAQTAEGQAAPAWDVEYRGASRKVGKSCDVGEHRSQVGTPHRPGADPCDTGVLDAGVVEGRCDDAQSATSRLRRPSTSPPCRERPRASTPRPSGSALAARCCASVAAASRTSHTVDSAPAPDLPALRQL